MKKKLRKYIILPLLAVLWLCGCGKKDETDKAEAVPDTAAETESQTEETEEKEQERTQYPVSEADTETIYADREKNQELADFLIAYYQIPEEFCAETRYYYDMVDLNEDGTLKRKADMFYKRTIKRAVAVTSVETSSEALAVS